MKKFIILQILIVGLSIGTCILFRAGSSDCGISSVRKISDLKEMKSTVDYIDYEIDSLPDFEEYLTLSNDRFFAEKIILVVKPNSEINLSARMIIQNVSVKDVIYGDESLIDNEITLHILNGFYYETKSDFKKRQLRSSNAKRGFFYQNSGWINVMNDESEYLLFANKLTVGGKDYYIPGSYFKWLNITNDYAVPVNDEPDVPHYNEYYENEFFSDNQKTIDDFFNLKHRILDYYGVR
jgi:hypothetical protein